MIISSVQGCVVDLALILSEYYRYYYYYKAKSPYFFGLLYLSVLSDSWSNAIISPVRSTSVATMHGYSSSIFLSTISSKSLSNEFLSPRAMQLDGASSGSTPGRGLAGAGI